jgi:hypothetical protein
MKVPGFSHYVVSVLVLIGGLVTASLSTAAAASGLPAAGVVVQAPLIKVDWQGPLNLPPRFRNHCAIDSASGRAYCSDHCGYEYQFYYCTPQSFGCCRISFGYCDWRGQLRCHP